MTERVTCPECGGYKKTGFILVKRGLNQFPCPFCQGAGEVSDERMAAWRRGQEMRKGRVAARVSLRQRAREMGISMTQLSKLERGSA